VWVKLQTFWKALLDPSLMQKSTLPGKTRVKLREKRTCPSSHIDLLAVSSPFLFFPSQQPGFRERLGTEP